MRKIKPKYSIWMGGSTLILLSALIAYLTPRKDFSKDDLEQVSAETSPLQQGQAREIGWRLLQTLDYQKGEKAPLPAELAAVVGQQVRIPGFAVPLGDQFQKVEEFLFVPNQMACIHVPAPPPHLVIYVHLRKTVKISEIDGPLWLEGILYLKPSQSIYGAAAYEMDGMTVNPYR